jgi:hypothetical protein
MFGEAGEANGTGRSEENVTVDEAIQLGKSLPSHGHDRLVDGVVCELCCFFGGGYGGFGGD